MDENMINIETNEVNGEVETTVEGNGTTEATSTSNLTSEKQQFIQELQTNEELKAIRLSRVKDVRVTKAVRAAGIAGNSGKDNIGRIVGYVVENISEKPVDLLVKQYTPDENGVYNGANVQVVLEPQKTQTLTKYDMGRNFVKPEFGGMLANGKISAGKKSTKDMSLDEILENTSFSFLRSANITITSAANNIVIDTKNGSNRWTVKEEFLPVFGYLQNQAKQRATKADISDKEAQAFIVWEMCVKQGLLTPESSAMAPAQETAQ